MKITPEALALLLRFKRELGFRDTNKLLLNQASEAHPSIDVSLSEIDWTRHQLERYEVADISLISIANRRYPKHLRLIPDPPSLLFVKGNADFFPDLKSVAIVGTRDATESGKIIALRMAAHFSTLGWCITSGLAMGIDEAAHQGALSVNGKTIAVLAGSVEEPFPKATAETAYKILEHGGSWVSEYPLGAKPLKQQFVRRNRLQVGISAGSIIVEAGLRSGSSTQARFCKEQKKPLFAVVPDDAENRLGLFSEGTMEFVNSGIASPIRTRDDYSRVESVLETSHTSIASESAH